MNDEETRRARAKELFRPPNKEDVERMFSHIGKIASDFGSLELTLDECICALLDFSDERTRKDDPRKISSFTTKVRTLQRVVRERITDAAALAELDELCKDMIAGSEKRNDVVHSTYIGIAGETNKLHQRWTKGRSRSKTVNGVMEKIDRGVFTMTEEQLLEIATTVTDLEYQLTFFFLTQFPNVDIDID